MEKVTETWVTLPERPVSMSSRNACLVHIYPTGPGMGARYTLADTPLVIGRGSDCDIRINDHSVSRRHAAVWADRRGLWISDLGSSSGTNVNGVWVDHVPKAGLVVGDAIWLGELARRRLGRQRSANQNERHPASLHCQWQLTGCQWHGTDTYPDRSFPRAGWNR